MSILLFLILFRFYINREFKRIEKDKILSFSLENSDKEYFAILEYADNYEKLDETDKDEDNDLNFLKIDNSLKVNCILLDKNIPEPDENLLNSTIPSEYCQQNMNINNNKKLIDFPQNIEENQKLYFIFYLDKNSSEIFNKDKIYQIQRISTPRILNRTKYEIEIKEKETLIYLFIAYEDYLLIAFSKLCIPIFEYNYQNGFIQIGQVGVNSPIFNCHRDEEPIRFYAYMVIDNFEEQPTSITFKYLQQTQYSKDNVNYFSFNYSEINQIKLNRVVQTINLIQISNVEDKLINFDCKDYEGEFQLFEFDNDSEYIESIKALKNFTNYKYVSKDFYSKKTISIFLLKMTKGLHYFHMAFNISEIRGNEGTIEMDNFSYFKIITVKNYLIISNIQK